MRLDEDDYEDYEEGGYNEDDRAFEELMVLVPNATEDDAWDALEKFDFDIPAAAAHLKAQAKPAAKPAIKPVDKLAAKPPIKKTPTPVAAPPSAHAPVAAHPVDNLKGKSKLQSLALKKQTGTTGGALEKLRLKASGEGEAGGGKKSALARLIAKKNEPPRAEIQSAATNGPPETSDIPPTAFSKVSASQVEFSQEKLFKPQRPDPSPFGSILGSPVPADFYSTKVSNAVKVTKESTVNFSKPSPDDQVVNAQAKAFNTPSQKPALKKKAAPKTKEKDIEKIASLSLKPVLNFVVLGHVDAGKSTLTGRMLIDVGAVPKSVLEKNKRQAEKIGKGSFALAWVMDATAQERARGVTVDVAKASFETDAKKFTILDAPGHKDYVPNMITGVSQADLALLVVDAGKNAFEAGFWSDGQTKEHAILARSMGIDSIIVAVNKLDMENWDEERFEELKVQLTEFLSKVVGFNPAKIQFVPTSGANGDYVAKMSSAAPWYKGPTLLQMLESTNAQSSSLDAPFRLASFETYFEIGAVLEATGRVLTGTLESGDPIVNCNQPEITGVAVMPTNRPPVIAGDTCTIHIKLENDEDLEKCRDGDIFTSPEGFVNNVHEFLANVIFFDLKRPVLTGSKLSFYMGSVNRSVKVTKILSCFDRKAKTTKKNPRHITRGQAAEIQLRLDEPLPLALASEISQLGRFVLRLDGATIGAGVVSSLF